MVPEIVAEYPLDGYLLIYECNAMGNAETFNQCQSPGTIPPEIETIPETTDEIPSNGETMACPVQKQISTASSAPSNLLENDGKLYYGDPLEFVDEMANVFQTSNILENIWEGDDGEDIIDKDQILLESLLDNMHLFPQVYENRQRDVGKCLLALKLFGKHNR